MTPEDQEKLERIDAQNEATVWVVALAGFVAFFVLTNREHPAAPLIGAGAVIWGLYLLLQYRYSWALLISSLVMIVGGASLWMGGR